MTNPVEELVTITIREKSTNLPLAGASVTLQKCLDPDPYGCLGYATLANLSSNIQGQVSFAKELDVDATDVKHEKYWNNFTDGLSDVTLIPKTIIAVSIHKMNSYAAGDILNIVVTSPNCEFGCLSTGISTGLPIDTIIYLNGYGYSDNVISWYINDPLSDTLHSLPSFFVNGFDSAHVAVDY